MEPPHFDAGVTSMTSLPPDSGLRPDSFGAGQLGKFATSVGLSSQKLQKNRDLSAEPKRGLDSRGLLMINVHFLNSKDWSWLMIASLVYNMV